MKKTTLLLVTAAVALSCLALTGCSGNSGSSTGDATAFDATHQITVVSRESGSGTHGAFTELLGIMEKGADGSETDLTTKDALIVNKTDVMLTNIGGDQYAIGYVSTGSLNDTVKTVKVDGVEPTSENIKSGAYTLARPFNIATNGQPSALAQDFIDFILSADGQAVVSESYIAINDGTSAYTASNQSGKLVVAGSSSVTPVMEKLKEAYIALNPNVEIEVQQSDSTAGMTSLIDGICDIGMASRDLKDSEAAVLTAQPIAMDGIALIVNPVNTCTDLTSAQAKDIFTGAVTTWDAVL